MKVLSGAVKPDAGRIELDGQPYASANPHQARKLGVAMIYQELNLAPHLTVEENIFLGVEQTRFGRPLRESMRRRVREALDQLQRPDIDPDARVADLSIGAQQLVEVARALITDARVIVMDEPTSSLTREDTAHLFELIHRLRDRGVSIVYISHFLEEVQAIADRFTVLRDGRTVGTGRVSDVLTREIIEMMVGRELDDMFPHVPHEPGETILELDALCGAKMPIDADLELRRGEILGVAGLIGAGRTELVRTVFGLDPVKGGRIKVAIVSPVSEIDRGRSPHRRLAQRIGMVSEDRKSEGLALPMSIADNTTLSCFGTVSHAGVLNLERQRRAARRWIERLDIRTQGPDQPIWNLSGGNQQKVAIARLLHQDAEVLLLDEPTRGIDVGAKVQIYQLMGELAAAGKAILFVSSYLPELMGMCDRIAVMNRGRIIEIRDRTDWTEHDVMAAATGEVA
jgi:ribose transport system ATP-binding protein